MNKIYVYRSTRDYVPCIGIAFTSEGEKLITHFSTSHSFFQYDMGLEGNTGLGKQKHEVYKTKYPLGYELVEVIGPDELRNILESK